MLRHGYLPRFLRQPPVSRKVPASLTPHRTPGLSVLAGALRRIHFAAQRGRCDSADQLAKASCRVSSHLLRTRWRTPRPSPCFALSLPIDVMARAPFTRGDGLTGERQARFGKKAATSSYPGGRGGRVSRPSAGRRSSARAGSGSGSNGSAPSPWCGDGKLVTKKGSSSLWLTDHTLSPTPGSRCGQ